MSSDRLERALRRCDEENALDPNRVAQGGEEVGKEWLYGRRMSATLGGLAPEASELVRLAVRAQHLRRWELPRAEYPSGRAGYLRWRAALGERHGAQAAAIAREVGYDDAFAERLSRVVKKRDFRSDVEAQQVEDVACLVFLEHHLADFAAKHDEEKVIEVLQKTWAKMSEASRARALGLRVGVRERSLLDRALAGS